jgi:DNA-binding NarL/FixJ family response regulator
MSLPLKVLIVDDSLLLRERLCCSLERIDGIEVAGKACDVQGGIEAFRRLQPDVVVLDLQMPGGTGIDVLEVIKRENPATKVLILTNHPHPQLHTKCQDAGAEWFFDKTEESGRVGEVLTGLVKERNLSRAQEDHRP